MTGTHAKCPLEFPSNKDLCSNEHCPNSFSTSLDHCWLFIYVGNNSKKGDLCPRTFKIQQKVFNVDFLSEFLQCVQIVMEAEFDSENGLFGFDNLVFGTDKKCIPR